MPFQHISEDALELLSLLRDIGTRFLRAEDVETVAGDVFDALSRTLKLGVYLNYLLADDGQSLRLASCAGIEDQAVVRSLAVLMPGQAICGTVAATGRRIVAENIQASDETLFSLVKSLGLTAYACHPLLAGERLIGTLSFGSRSRESFTRAELELMQTAATFAAIAIDRATIAERQRRTQMLLTSAQEDERRRIAAQLAYDDAAVKIVVLSVHEDRSYVQRLVAAGAAADVLKRSAVSQLIHAIRTVSMGGRYVDPAFGPALVEPFGLPCLTRDEPADVLELRSIREGPRVREPFAPGAGGDKLCPSNCIRCSRRVALHRRVRPSLGRHAAHANVVPVIQYT